MRGVTGSVTGEVTSQKGGKPGRLALRTKKGAKGSKASISVLKPSIQGERERVQKGREKERGNETGPTRRVKANPKSRGKRTVGRSHKSFKDCKKKKGKLREKKRGKRERIFSVTQNPLFLPPKKERGETGEKRSIIALPKKKKSQERKGGGPTFLEEKGKK